MSILRNEEAHQPNPLLLPGSTGLRDRETDRRYERCEFALGRGPCGLWVSELRYALNSEFLTITQEALPDSAGSEVKEFIYLVSEITGRIEVTSV